VARIGALALVLALGVVAACGGNPRSSSARVPQARPVPPFDFVTPDGSHLSSEGMRGRVTAVLFITTYDLNSQLAVRELSDVFHRAKPRINAFAIALEPPRNAALVETFAETLELPFPVTIADAATLESRGPFGVLRGVPTLFVLDAVGRERARIEGAARSSVIESAIDSARH
jgi:hypothetical protein